MAYNRLINAIWWSTTSSPSSFWGQVPSELAQMIIEWAQLFGKPPYGVDRRIPNPIISEIKSHAAAKQLT